MAAVTTDNATEPLLRIDHLSTSFFSTSDNGIVYIQVSVLCSLGIQAFHEYACVVYSVK